MVKHDGWRQYASIEASQPVEASWNTLFGALVQRPEGHCAAASTWLTRRFPLPGLSEFRVTCQVTGTVRIEASRYSFSPGNRENPAARVQLAHWVVAVTGLSNLSPDVRRTLLCERTGGRLRLSVDGVALLDAEDPVPGELVLDVSLELSAGAVLHAFQVEGVPQAGELRPLPPRSAYNLYACIDFYDDIILNAWSEKTFRAAMELYKANRVKRLYFIYDYGSRGGFWDQSGSAQDFPGLQENIRRTRESVGDFLPATVQAAHCAGLPIYAVLKPFDTAYALPTGTFSEGSQMARRYGKIPRLGGPIWMSLDWVAQNSALRIERDVSDVPADLDQRSVRTIVLKAEPGLKAELDPARVRLWTSRDNGRYKPYAGPMAVRMERRDAVTLTLDGLAIPERFFAVTVEGAPTRSFGNRLRDLIEVRDEQGRALPVTFANRPRQQGADWRAWGLVVDVPDNNVGASEDYAWLDGPKPLGVALGRERYLQGALCFGHDEVQDWAMSQVENCIDAGVDGIDFRIVNHNRTFDWSAFGFNPPVVRAFKERYGVDILREPFDRESWRRLRGEFYTSFLRRAVARLRQAGLSAQAHISARMGDPRWHTEMEMHFDWRGWIAEGLLDEVTIKMAGMRNAPGAVAAAIAAKAGLPVNFCPALPPADQDRQWVAHLINEALEGGADGFTMYENATFMRANDREGVELTAPWIVEELRRHASP